MYNRTLKNIPVQNIKFCTGILLYIKNNYLSIVDLGRIELPSKRGNHMLSTCLSLPKFSCRNRTKAINSCLILLSFIKGARPPLTIPDVTAPLNRNASEQQLPSDVTSQHLVPGLSFNLLYFD